MAKEIIREPYFVNATKKANAIERLKAKFPPERWSVALSEENIIAGYLSLAGKLQWSEREVEVKEEPKVEAKVEIKEKKLGKGRPKKKK